jgi:hypothetical protein
MPTSAATIRQIALKSRRGARNRNRMPSRAACFAIWDLKRGRIRQSNEIASSYVDEIDMATAGRCSTSCGARLLVAFPEMALRLALSS